MARQAGNETTTLQDPQGQRQIPTCVRYDAECRRFGSRTSKSCSNFLHILEVSRTIEEQMEQFRHIHGFVQHLIKEMGLGSQLVVAFPAHYTYYTRCVFDAVLRQSFTFCKLVPAHLCVAAQYWFRCHPDFQQRSRKFGFLQVNEFDTVYSSFSIYKEEITTRTFRVLKTGSQDIDMILFRMACRQNRQLPDTEETFRKYIYDIKKAKTALSLGQDGTIAFPEFDVRINAARFEEEFRFIQKTLLDLIEPDLDSFEILGGGGRLIKLPPNLKRIQTKRLNPDEVLAQGALVYYLLTAQKKLVVKDFLQTSLVTLDGAPLLSQRQKYPTTFQIQKKLTQGQLLKLLLPNGFTIKEYKVAEVKNYFKSNIQVQIDECQEVNISLAPSDGRLDLVFEYFNDTNLIADLQKFEAFNESKDRAFLEALSRQNEELVTQNSYEEPTAEYKTFFQELNSGLYDNFLTVPEMRSIQRIQTEDQQKDFTQSAQGQKIIKRKYAYDHAEELLEQLKQQAAEMELRNPQRRIEIQSYIRQITQSFEQLKATSAGQMTMDELLDPQGLQRFVGNLQ